MGLELVVVELPTLPSRPTREEDDAVASAREVAERGGLLQRLLRPEARAEATEWLDRAEHLARRRLERLEAFGQEALLALGQAWLAAGAPGRPQVKASLDLQLDQEAREYDQRFAMLSRRHDHVMKVLDEVEQRFDGQVRALDGRLMYLEDLYAVCEAGIGRLRSEGMFRALDLLEELPDAYHKGIPRTNVTELKQWTERLKRRIRADQEELELERARLEKQKLQQMTQAVAADAVVLEKVKGLIDARERNREALHTFLRGVGSKLVPAAESFANGGDVTRLLAEARVRHAETRQRLEEVEELRAALAEEREATG